MSGGLILVLIICHSIFGGTLVGSELIRTSNCSSLCPQFIVGFVLLIIMGIITLISVLGIIKWKYFP